MEMYRRFRTVLGEPATLYWVLFPIVMLLFLLYFFDPKLVLDSRPELLGTSIGAVLGYVSAYYIERTHTRVQEKETIKNILISIIMELEINLKDLEDFDFKASILYFTRVQNTAFDSAIGGGYFSLMDLETQHKLSVLYAELNFMTYISDKLLLMREDDKKLAIMNSMLEKHLIKITKDHKEVIKYLRARAGGPPNS